MISAFPRDKKLNDALSKGACAAAEAEQAETVASGNARALMIKAKAEATASKIKAEALADAERIAAKGSMEAGVKLEQNATAMELARLQSAGLCLSQKKAFFLGGSPSELPALLSRAASQAAPQEKARGMFG